MSTHDPEKLEAAIHRVLRSVPGRKAPEGLENRVLAELSRRASLPWWHRSFAYWPVSARIAFFAGSALAAALLISGIIALAGGTGAHAFAGVTQTFAWLGVARDLVASVNHNLRLVIGAIPSPWLYGIVGTIAICYATLAAISAATYRALSFGRATP